MAICGCTDSGCLTNHGSECTHKATQTLYRIDMEDVTGTPFCDACASDAFESGVFTDRSEDEYDDFTDMSEDEDDEYEDA